MNNHSFIYEYARPALTVDALVFKKISGSFSLLLIKRKYEPFKDCWAFPGGFVEENEKVEIAVIRELKEETGLVINEMDQIYTASAPGRDPRGWTVSVIFMGIISSENVDVKAGDDAAEAQWYPIDKLPKLAFDHREIAERAIGLINH